MKTPDHCYECGITMDWLPLGERGYTIDTDAGPARICRECATEFVVGELEMGAVPPPDILNNVQIAGMVMEAYSHMAPGGVDRP